MADLFVNFDDGATTGLTINVAGSGAATVPTITLLHGTIKVDDWIKAYTQNPVIPKRSGKWDSYATRDLSPVLGEDGYPVLESGKMIALYRGYNGTSNQGGRATSTDEGLTWGDRLDSPVLPLGGAGTWFQHVCSPASVVKRDSDGVYVAFCGGKDASDVPRIGCFTSSDLGLTWTDGGYKLELASFIHPNTLVNMGVPWVIKGESGYLMFFEGVSATPADWRIYGATATSLTGTWTPMNSGNPIVSPGSAGAWDDFGIANPKVVRVAANQYLMAYNGNKNGVNIWKVGFATATTDLTSWTRHANNPVLAGEGTGWESSHTECSALFKNTSAYMRFYYQGYTAANDDPQIALAKCHQGRLLAGLSSAVADGYLFGSMQPDAFWSSILTRNTLDSSDDSALVYMLYDSASVPSPGVNTDINPLRRFMVLRRSPTNATNPNKLFIAYVDTSDGIHYWDGDSWEAAPAYFGGKGLYEIRIWDDGTNFKADIIEFFSGVSILTAVASIAKASVKAFSNGRALCYGDPYTSHYYLGQKFDNVIIGPIAPTLTVASLAHADSLGAVMLTQVHNLAVNGLSHAHSVESFALTQAHLLAINALSHTHSIDAPALTQVHQLAVQALNHSHTLGTVLLLQIHNLAVQNLAHAHSIENVILALNFLLIVEDLIHGHSLGTVALLQDTLLIVQNLQHNHSLDSFALTQIRAVLRDFIYKTLKAAPSPDLPEGDFEYKKVS